jgi:hypothetical protein
METFGDFFDDVAFVEQFDCTRVPEDGAADFPSCDLLCQDPDPGWPLDQTG